MRHPGPEDQDIPDPEGGRKSFSLSGRGDGGTLTPAEGRPGGRPAGTGPAVPGKE